LQLVKKAREMFDIKFNEFIQDRLYPKWN